MSNNSVSYSEETTVIHVVMVFVLIGTLAAACFLVSAPPGIMDGARPWAANSLLQSVAEALGFNYAHPTLQGIAVKSFVLSIGAALGVLLVGIGSYMYQRRLKTETFGVEGTAANADEIAESPSTARANTVLRMSQFLFLLYLLWSFASIQWSPEGAIAYAGSILLGIQLCWVFALGYGLNRRTACWGAVGLVVVTALLGGLAVWYFYVRNPVLRASFPIGNPLFLAACLIPGIVLSAGLLLFTVVGGAGQGKSALGGALLGLTCLVGAGWAFHLTGSRGPLLGLVCAVPVALFFMLRGKGKLITSLAAVVIVVGSALYFQAQQDASSVTGRSATIRTRLYAWEYAAKLVAKSPLTGFGQGGYAMLGDSYAADDVEHDPLALKSRIAHAHNEWLEVCADLGIVGLAVLLAAYAATLYAGVMALRGADWSLWRVALTALLAALVALMIEELTNVGLRVAGLPVVYYTVLGLIWALIRHEPRVPRPGQKSPLGAGWPALLLSIVVCAAVFSAGYRDWQGARAGYELRGALQERKWEQGINLANQALAGRLNPARKLKALYDLSTVHSYVAGAYQRSAIRRWSQRDSSQESAEHTAQLVSEDVRRSKEQVQFGSAVLERLVAGAPGYWGAGRLGSVFYEILAQFAQRENDPEGVENYLEQIADAMAGELKRRPFDADTAIRYLMYTPDLPVEKRLDVLARPLRMGPASSLLSEMLTRLATEPGFVAVLEPLMASPPEEKIGGYADWPDCYLPEKLRIAGLVAFRRGDFDSAINLTTRSLAYYEVIPGLAPFAQAAAYRQRGYFRFHANSLETAAAITDTRRALEGFGESFDTAAERRLTKLRLVAYNLAAGREEEARRIIEELNKYDPTADINRRLGIQYVALCENLARRPRELIPDDFGKWVDRAGELAPDYPPLYRLRAQTAIWSNDCERLVESIRKLRDLGGAPETVGGILVFAMERVPDCPALQELGEQWGVLEATDRSDEIKPVVTPKPPEEYPPGS